MVPAAPSTVEVPGAGPCLLPGEFEAFTGPLPGVERMDARTSPKTIHERLASGAALLLSGPYAYVDGVMRYCQHNERGLVSPEEVSAAPEPARRSAAFSAARRRKLHSLLLLAAGDSLSEVTDAPETAGLREWLETPVGDRSFLIPVRRFQRILTDMVRVRDGVPVGVLGGTITIRPHVYVPADQSVPGMLMECASLLRGKRVLDVGTGTGVLALIAAKLGAASVVATDSNPRAVENARANAERFGLSATMEVRGPGDLFEPVRGESFDVVIFNAPWIQGEPRTLYDTANYDPGFRVIDGFMRDVPRHLAPGGAVLLQYSNISQRTGEDSIVRLERLIAGNGFEVASTRAISRLSRVLGAREQVRLLELRRRAGAGES